MLHLTRLLQRWPAILALASVSVLIAPLRAASAQFSAPSARSALPTGLLTSPPPTGCQPSWRPTFGVAPGTNGTVAVLAVFDDGRGPDFYAGGSFTTIGGGAEACIADWGNTLACGNPANVACEPGVGGVIACPCGNAPASTGLGCDNSSNTGGAQLTATGIARLTFDTVVFTATGEKPTGTSIVLQGNGLSATGVVFGQGVGCVASNLKRMYVKTASAGSFSVPHHTDPHVHLRSAALGDVIAAGTHRYYGVYYRDPIVLGGCPVSSTYNITQELDVLWAP